MHTHGAYGHNAVYHEPQLAEQLSSQSASSRRAASRGLVVGPTRNIEKGMLMPRLGDGFQGLRQQGPKP